MALAAFAVIVLIAGLNFVAVRFSNRELPPFWGASLRFGSASLLFFIIAAVTRVPLPRGRALAGALVYGALGFAASYGFVYWGLVRAPAGMASVMIALVPMLTLLLAFVHGLERLRWRGIAGALIAFAGTALVFGEQLEQLGGSVPLPSLFALLAAAVAIAESIVIAKWFPRTHPVATNAVGMAAGAALLLLPSAITQESWGLPALPATWFAVTYLVLIGSIILFGLFLFVVSRWTASATSYTLVLAPLVAVPVGAFLAGETVTSTLIVGGALVLAGVYVGAIAPMKTPPA